MSFQIVFIILIIINIKFTSCHIIGDLGQINELKRACDNAYLCFHDTIIVCGKSVMEARTFMDLCDLYEYSCENSMVYRKVKEEDGVCPNPKDLGAGLG